jgi:hypothetical protein
MELRDRIAAAMANEANENFDDMVFPLSGWNPTLSPGTRQRTAPHV